MKKQDQTYAIVQHGKEGVDRKLLEFAEKHKATPYLAPIPGHQQEAVDELLAHLPDMPIILDSGCGTGMSTQRLAEQYPGHFIIGIDKSAHRLKKQSDTLPNNATLTRLDLIHAWRLFQTAGLSIDQHYLFYPNPWPKDLKKRFHGHPIAKTLFSLCPSITLRTNWDVYAEEFGLVASNIYGLEIKAGEIKPDNPITLFEKKYLEHDVVLFEVTTHPR